MISIAVEDPDASRGAIQISWRTTPGLLDALAQAGVKEPKLLIVTAPEGAGYHSKLEMRRVVDMRDGIAFVSFLKDGPNAIHALVVWDKDDKDPADKLCVRKDNDWVNTILTTDGTAVLTSDKCTSNIWTLGKEPVRTSSSVLVPEGCFAEPPNQTLAAWVNWLHDDPPVDTCRFWQRASFAFTGQIPLFVIAFLMRMVIGLALFLQTARGVDYRPLFHPLTQSWVETIKTVDGFHMVPKVDKGKWYRPLAPLLMFLAPGSLLFIHWILSTVLMSGTNPASSLTVLKVTMVLIIGLMVTICLCILFTTQVVWALAEKYVDEGDKKPEPPPWYLQASSRAFLTAELGTGDQHAMDGTHRGRQLPRFSLKPKVIILYVRDHKAASCKPYAK
ncbi:MAG: hypothetical protein HQ488_02150 [Parcubacteria group bacterium]|nr:hypothetical protein [Parcubacteria group bacterium]